MVHSVVVQPGSRYTCSLVNRSDLYDGVDVYEIQSLDLVGFQSMGALHPGQDGHNLLCQRTEHGRSKVKVHTEEVKVHM